MFRLCGFYIIIGLLLFGSRQAILTPTTTNNTNLNKTTSNSSLNPSPSPKPPTTKTSTTSTLSISTSTTTLTTPFQTQTTKTSQTLLTQDNITLHYRQYLSTYKPEETLLQGSPEYVYRELVYARNLEKINRWNGEGGNSFVLGLNAFTDVDQMEFISTYARLIPMKVQANLRMSANIRSIAIGSALTPGSRSTLNLPPNPTPSTPQPPLGNILLTLDPSIPSPSPSPSFTYTAPPENINIDWSNKTSDVIHQGRCGSCYVICPLESIYVTYRIYGRNVLPFSVQEVLSCMGGGGGFGDVGGCVAGYFESAYQYVEENGVGPGLLYPYDPRSQAGILPDCNTSITEKPSYKSSKIKIKQHVNIRNGDCAALVRALQTRAISVAIASKEFQFYKKGLFTTTSNDINHGVTLVGYSSETQYKIKNSWGIAWGMKGFAYISQSTGVCDYGIYPVTGLEG